jgi:hypothetical protein
MRFNLNVTIHHKWASLFALHMNSKSQIPTYNNASSDNFDSNNENIHRTPINSTIHNFLNAPKIMNYEIIIYLIAPSQNFHLLGLFKDKHWRILNSHLFWLNSHPFFAHFFMRPIICRLNLMSRGVGQTHSNLIYI